MRRTTSAESADTTVTLTGCEAMALCSHDCARRPEQTLIGVDGQGGWAADSPVVKGDVAAYGAGKGSLFRLTVAQELQNSL